MGVEYVPKRTSDISKTVVSADTVITAVFNGKVWDMSPEELAKLKPMDNVIQVELRFPDTTTRQLVCSKKDFDALIPDEMFQKFDSSRGRRTGFKPGNGNGNGNH